MWQNVFIVYITFRLSFKKPLRNYYALHRRRRERGENIGSEKRSRRLRSLDGFSSALNGTGKGTKTMRIPARPTLTSDVTVFFEFVPYERVHVHVRCFAAHAFSGIRQFQFGPSCCPDRNTASLFNDTTMVCIII